MEPVSLTIRIPEDLHRQLTARAKQEDRTLASLIRVLLAQAVRPPLADVDLVEYGMRHGRNGPHIGEGLDPAAVKAWAESRQR